jgi:hypothetical protein
MQAAICSGLSEVAGILLIVSHFVQGFADANAAARSARERFAPATRRPYNSGLLPGTLH